MKAIKSLSRRPFCYYLDHHKANSVNMILKSIKPLHFQNLKNFGFNFSKDYLNPSIRSLDLNFSQIFINEVVACCLDKSHLLNEDISKEAKEIAKKYLSTIIVGAYSDSSGIASIRQNYMKLSQQVDDANNLTLSDIFLTSGQINGIDLVLTTIMQEGDQILIPNPSSPYVLNYCESKRHKIIDYPIISSLDFESLQKLVDTKSLTSPIKALVFSNPQEITGKVYDPEEIEKVIQFCHKNKLVLISIESSKHMIHNNSKQFSSSLKVLNKLAPEIKNTLDLYTVLSSSKTIPNVSSFRSGALILTNVDPQIKAQLIKYKSIDLCSSVPSQIIFDLVINKSMFSILGDEFKKNYESSIIQSKEIIIKKKTSLLNCQNSNLELKDIDAGLNIFAQVRNGNSNDYVTNYYNRHEDALVSPGQLYGNNFENYINLIINPDSDYGFLTEWK